MSDDINIPLNIFAGNQALLSKQSEVNHSVGFHPLIYLDFSRMNQMIWLCVLKGRGRIMDLGGSQRQHCMM